MALELNITMVSGIKVDGAYARIENVNLNKTNMRFTVRKYVDKTLPAFSDEVIECEYDLMGENPIKQAYEYLKTLEEYTESIEV